ncbi:hypothetical protein KOW79_012579 [Hemibagrus wyckioides]|uniref:Uncharacterized protein n=1 Tax=Hemibagrus wyckioides TaxID=337641 RepID=A0A9D3NKG5_9TELE|nr:hypothetical protein KOW79_012579 [Hemibagrus wyckioides]
MLILTVLVLYSSTVSLVLAHNKPRYLREFHSGQAVLCDLCPPGYHVQKHCTKTQQTICWPCNEGLYSEVWNYIYRCLPCRWCWSNQVEVQKCTSSTNRVCKCKEGFYLDSDICRPHSVCPSGYIVKEKGSPDRDTVCERCQEGYYADGHSGNASCVPHSECKSEEKLLFHGTIYMDNVCITCKSIAHDDWVKFVIQPFTAIFKHHSTWKLQRFIGHLISKDSRIFRFIADKNFCFQQLEEWFSKATEQQVNNLPKLLQKASMSDLAENIKQRIKKLRNEVRLCRMNVPARK